MKRHGRGVDLVQRALQLSGIRTNNMPGGSEIKRKHYSDTTVVKHNHNFQNPKRDIPSSNINLDETAQQLVDLSDQNKTLENPFVQETSNLQSLFMMNPTSSSCFPDETTGQEIIGQAQSSCLVLGNETTISTSIPESEPPDLVLSLNQHEPMEALALQKKAADDIQTGPCSSSSMLIHSSIFLDETTGEIQNPTGDIQKSPCSSPSMLNSTFSSYFLDETTVHEITGQAQSSCVDFGSQTNLSTSISQSAPVGNITIDQYESMEALALQEIAVGDNQNASFSSSSVLVPGSIFLDERTGEIRSDFSVLPHATTTPNSASEIVQQDVDFNCSDDDRDSTYEPGDENSSDYDSNTENVPLIRKRRGIRRQLQWDRNRQKMRRMQGKNYKGLKKLEGKWTQTNLRPARELKDACNCSSAKFECRKVTEDARKKIHENFWRHLNWEQRKVYVASLITKVQPTSRRQNIESSRRNITLLYHLRLNETKFRVCKQMFLNTLDLGEKSVRMWSIKTQSGIPTSTTPRPTQTHTDRDNHFQSFLTDLPKMESHYCRANSSKIYLEPNWGSLKELHSFYQTKATEDNIKPFSWTHFAQELKRQNITLFQNRKDQCDTFFAFKESRLDKTTYDLHILRKTMGREEKSSDKRLAEMDNTMKVFCVDVQAVLLAPKLNVSLAYYKIKLKLHNFTSFDLVTRKGRCYLWDEVNGGLDAEVFASLYVDLIKTEFERSETNLTKIVLWSDGCCYQNRNQVVANAILNCAVELGIVIEQKYLEHGHTFMEVYSEHSAIERKIKKKDVFIPAEYIEIIKSARINNPYEVHSLKYNFFKDYSKLQYYTSIRPGNKAGDNVVNDIRSLKYNPCGTIEYKIMYDDDWILLPRRAKLQNPNIELPALYDSKININLRKFHDLQDLKVLLHENYHAYYDTLPHECQSQICPHVKRT